ncbi:Uncharacterised protein [Mobiluncus mulieris]|nr:Uncharacterised protein [Mobiluncus mulieris]
MRLLLVSWLTGRFFLVNNNSRVIDQVKVRLLSTRPLRRFTAIRCTGVISDDTLKAVADGKANGASVWC